MEIAALFARVKRFAEFGSLQAPGQINSEGDGFFAIKTRGGLRAYCFYHGPGRILISHFQMKKGQKLDPKDKIRMEKNRKHYQGEKNEKNHL